MRKSTANEDGRQRVIGMCIYIYIYSGAGERSFEERGERERWRVGLSKESLAEWKNNTHSVKKRGNVKVKWCFVGVLGERIGKW